MLLFCLIVQICDKLSNNFVKPNEQRRACLHFAMARNCRHSQHDENEALSIIARLSVNYKNKKEENSLELSSFVSFVRLIGLEPTRRKTPDPKSGASTNFATRAIDF